MSWTKIIRSMDLHASTAISNRRPEDYELRQVLIQSSETIVNPRSIEGKKPSIDDGPCEIEAGLHDCCLPSTSIESNTDRPHAEIDEATSRLSQGRSVHAF